MRRVIGETYEFSNGQYKVVGDHLLKRREKNPFIIKMNIGALVFIFVGFVMTYLLFWSNTAITIHLGDAILYLVVFIVFIVVHELLHGISFVLFSKNKWSTMKFGVVLKSGVAYCISLVPVQVPRARLSLMMPIYLVCVPLYVYAFIAGSFTLALLGVLLASGSVGDFYYMWKLKGVSKDLFMYEELPTKTGYEIGFYLFEKVESA